MQPQSAPLSLMALWSRHKRECRGIGAILDDAREGRLPGVAKTPTRFGFEVTDEAAALAAMRRYDA